MNYKRIYDEFIADRRVKEAALIASGEYFERHHIQPRSLGGSDEKSNMIALTAGDHAFAHLMLGAIYGGHQWLPIVRMCKMPKQIGEKFQWRVNKTRRAAYAIAKKKHAEHMSKIQKGKKFAQFDAWRDQQENTTVFYWINKNTGENFSGTLRQLSAKTGIATNKLSCVAFGRIPSRKGWMLQSNEVRKTIQEITAEKARTQRTWFVNVVTKEKVYSSPVLMAETFGGKTGRYSHAERGKGTAYGWIKEGTVIRSGKFKTTESARTKKVVCITTGKEFPSIISASKNTGVDRRLIGAVLAEKQKTAGGYRWAYAS